jgi:putative hemolysin
MNKLRIGKESISKLINNNLIKKVIKASQNFKGEGTLSLIDKILAELSIDPEIIESEMMKIPEKGAFITVSNQPFYGLDSLIVLRAVLSKRPDFKIFAENIFAPNGLFTDVIIDDKDWISALGKAREWMNLEHPVGFFPVGSDINRDFLANDVADLQWRTATLKFIKAAKVPVVPVYVCPSKGRINTALTKIHPILGNKLFVPNYVPKKNTSFKVRIGNVIPAKELADFSDLERFGRFLRLKTYHLGSGIDVKQFFKFPTRIMLKSAEEIIAPVDKEVINREIEQVRDDYFLFRSSNFSVYCIPSSKIPNILRELGRLREITFREIGEGTNRSLDVDEFDLYYYQLIIWDEEEKRIAGAYRVGKGEDIINQYGIAGFYLNTLFRIKEKFTPVLKESLELGRSFIVKEYQRKPLSLFLLWKGILYFLIKNPEYRYLIGPVSISGDFSESSKSMIVTFIEQNYYRKDLSKFIRPRKKFRFPKKFLKTFDQDAFLDSTGKDFKKLDKYIKEIDKDLVTPVLLKKYTSLGAQILGFNVDPDFNYCLDGLIILDLFDVPLEILEALSKEIEDDSILERFNFPGLYN